MPVNWFLLLLMLPGWLLPSGLRFSTCRCASSPTAEQRCCAVAPSSACCAPTRTDEDTPGIERESECSCFVAVPEHSGKCALAVASACVTIPDRALEALGWAPFPEPSNHVRATLARPRGPSPGRPIPLPLRL
jgi:hypothetical protein